MARAGVVCDDGAGIADKGVDPCSFGGRLGRINEKTGYDMRRLADVVELLIAIKLAKSDQAMRRGSDPS